MNIRWEKRDRHKNCIYITEERWEHIIDPDNHPEMEDLEDELMKTIETGKRRQDALNSQKYFYNQNFDDLGIHNTEIEAVVLFRLRTDRTGNILPNNYIVTAYPKG